MLRGEIVVLVLVLLPACHLQPKQRPVLSMKFGATGVSPSFRMPPATWEECSKLDSSAVGWTASGVLFGALGASGGGGAAAADDPTTRYAVGGVAAGLTVFAAMSTFLGSHYAKRYTNRCTVNDGGRPDTTE